MYGRPCRAGNQEGKQLEFVTLGGYFISPIDEVKKK